ncbi:MAG: PAS domain S-box protein [Nitrospirae bacterium]|nr:PAS domain S-box protein [Nitrospirota bacterium]
MMRFTIGRKIGVLLLLMLLTAIFNMVIMYNYKYVPTQEVVQKNEVLLVIVMFGFDACIFVIGIFLSVARLSKPLKTLSILAGRIGHGDFSQNIAIPSSKDEISELTEAFNDMIVNLKESTVSRDYVNNIIDSMTDSLIVTDHMGRIKTVNTAACKMLGYSSDELMGNDVAVFFYKTESSVEQPVDAAKHKCSPRICPTSNFTDNMEQYLRRRDGSVISTLFSASVMQDKGCAEKPHDVVCVIKDITERKSVEEKLKKNYHIQSAISDILKISLKSISLKEQLERILDLILSIPWIAMQAKGCIFLVEDDPEVLVMKAYRGLPDELVHVCAELPFGKCLCGAAATAKSMVFKDRVDDDHQIKFEGMEDHGHYVIAILSAGKILGVLNLYMNVGHKRDQSEEVFLIAVANTLAGIIERKSIEEAIQKAKNELEIRVKERTEKLNASLEEKETLLTEIHHRVKNNLQIVSSLIRLQSRGVTDEKYANIFRDSESRIQSMALIHEELYRSEDFSNINFKGYIKNLIDSLFVSYGISNEKIRLNLQIEELMIGIDSAIPCGLIINELITNSIKYAFPDSRSGEISVRLRLCSDDNACELTVSDNGVGIAQGLDYKRTKSVGLNLVVNLVENQLNGQIEIRHRQGTEFLIKFKRHSLTEERI